MALPIIGSLMKKILLNVILNGGALYVVTEFLEGINYSGGLKFFLIGGLILGFLNAIIKPILKLMSLPLIILTLGLMLAVINGFLLFLLEKIIGYLAISGISFSIDGISMYLIGGLVFGIVNFLEHILIKTK